MECDGWRALKIVIDGEDFRIEGIHIWEAEWRNVDPIAIKLPHPDHPNQKADFWIYEIGSGTNIVRFAAGELSNCVWGFYIPV